MSRITGGQIDRSRSLRFTFDGQTYTGHPGDTLASALLANGVRLMGRSFKYHRPRGLLCMSGRCPNCLLNIKQAPQGVDPSCKKIGKESVNPIWMGRGGEGRVAPQGDSQAPRARREGRSSHIGCVDGREGEGGGGLRQRGAAQGAGCEHAGHAPRVQPWR